MHIQLAIHQLSYLVGPEQVQNGLVQGAPQKYWRKCANLLIFLCPPLAVRQMAGDPWLARQPEKHHQATVSGRKLLANLRLFILCSIRWVFFRIDYLTVFCLMLLVTVAGCSDQPRSASASQQLTPAVQAAAGVISATDLERDIRELSSNSYGGREPSSMGDLKTQQFIVQRLKALGFTPGAGQGEWLQGFQLLGLDAQQPSQWSFTTTTSTRTFRQGIDFIVASGAQTAQVAVQETALVFVGYGIQAPEYDWDDYKGMDVSGKILVMLNNDPHTSDDLFQGETRLYYGRWTYKYEIAAALGAAGVIIVHTDYSAGYPWQVVQTSWSGPQFELPNEAEETIQLKAWMTEAASRQLLAIGGKDLSNLTKMAQSRDFQPVILPIRTSLAMTVTTSVATSANVLGLLPGSDLELGEEVIVYTAHHDHLGINIDAQAGADAIYNGAMDNASGVASVLGIAKAFSQLRPAPKRSMLFAFVGAEEQGLLGSKYFVRHPTFAPGKIAANVNMDGGQIAGRSKDVSYIGYGRSSIDQVADQVAAFQGRKVVSDQSPSAGYFYRSDHFSLARIGVPSLNFQGGNDLRDGGLERGEAMHKQYVAQHYHQPSDEVTEDWCFDGLLEDAQYGFYAGYLLAEHATMPSWVKGDEFAAARLAALAE